MAFNAKRNDTKKFTQGAWVLIMGGMFRIARAGNPDYEKAKEATGFRTIEDPEEKQQALYEAIATGIIKGWDDVEDNEGKPIPFSVENAVQVLEENPDLMNKILAEANNLSNYRRDDLADQRKKPVAGSGSSTNGDQGRKRRESTDA